MSWNYRVLRTTDPDGTPVFTVREVFYDGSGAVVAWTAEPTAPQGESFAELTRDVAAYQAALRQPVLAESEGDLYDIGLMGRRTRTPKLVVRAAQPTPGAAEGGGTKGDGA